MLTLKLKFLIPKILLAHVCFNSSTSKKKVFQKEASGYKTQSKCPPTLGLTGHWGRILTGLQPE